MGKETVKLFDSELKVMDVLWKEGDVPAKHVADVLTKELGWNKNTTYIPKEEVQEAETNELINKIYDGL